MKPAAPTTPYLRIFIACGLLVLGLTVFSFKVIYLQWVDGAETAKKAKRSHYTTEVFPSQRGLIVDRNEEILVRNISICDIHADKYHLTDPDVISWGVAYKRLKDTPEWKEADQKAQRKLLSEKRFSLVKEYKNNSRELVEEHLAFAISALHQDLDTTKSSLREKLEHPRKKDIKIARNLEEDVANKVEAALHKNHIQGFHFRRRLKRHYCAPNLAPHTVGFVNAKGEGVTGIEKLLHSRLHGKDGYIKRKRGVRGQALNSKDEEIVLPEAGFNVQLTLDMNLQSIVEEELDAAMKFSKSKRGCVIVTDPYTGQILALANRPHFNLNNLENIAESSFNFALRSTLEPGSTFKIVAAASAMNEGLVNQNTKIFCENGHMQGNRFKLNDHHPYGMLSVTGILAKSSNIGSYKLGRQVGKERFFQYVDAFGFGKKSGLGWPGEPRTKASMPKRPVEFASSTYGYAVSVTPLQLVMAYSAVANSGTLMKPYLVSKVISDEGLILEQNEPTEVKKVLKPYVATRLRGALAEVTQKGGTATRAAVEGYKVAGKTGTTKKFIDGKYQNGRYLVSFAGMMPAEKPKFVAVVLLDDPQTNEVARYGGTLAAPVFSEIAKRAAIHFNLKPTEAIDESPALSSTR